MLYLKVSQGTNNVMRKLDDWYQCISGEWGRECLLHYVPFYGADGKRSVTAIDCFILLDTIAFSDIKKRYLEFESLFLCFFFIMLASMNWICFDSVKGGPSKMYK